MFWEILVAVLAGVLTGIFTGITPGVHINLVAVLLVSFAGALSSLVSLPALACFLMAVGVTHTFLDILPSTFLGAPDDHTALGMLPAHRLLLQGRGLDAVRLSTIGALLGLLLSFVFFVPFFFFTRFAYPYLGKVMGLLLLLVASYMIMRDRERLWAAIIFLMSGLLGVVVFSLHVLHDPLLPMLSGLFGISSLLMSLKDKNHIPKQALSKGLRYAWKRIVRACVSGNCSSYLTSALPGLSSSIAATMSVQVTKKLHDDGFLVLLGAIGTAGFTLSLVAALAVGKARNGAVLALQSLLVEITMPHVIMLCVVSLIAGAFSAVLALFLGRSFALWISKLNYQWLATGVICFVVILVGLMTSWLGLLVLMISTAIGMLPALVKTTRTQAMGCLMVPVLIYFLV